MLIEVIPELEAIIGKQPAVPPLPPVEAKNRFHSLFDRFLGCLAGAESPLCLFIDDLQWCDVASFDFLQTVFANREEHPYLLLLGAYRHNEVDSDHPLAKLIAKVRAGGNELEEIRLRPLDPNHCHEMVSYILDAPLSHSAALADYLADLTEGNPLFVRESLSYLYTEDLLYVDDELEWRWDLERIRRSKMPSTVVGLFSSKIGRLPAPAIDLLETSACMGNAVAPEDLGRVRGLALSAVFELLKPALSQGLLVENRGQLQFIHDRVQEAVLAGIPAERRRIIHWQVGERLLEAAPTGVDLEALENLFSIASHLNLGRPEPLARADAVRLADINFHAGEKALNSLATEAANAFFGTAKNLLPADCWETEYDKTFKIFRKAAKTELMCGHQERSDALLDELLARASTDLNRAECLADQTTSLSSIGDLAKAIETGNRGLATFDKAIPDDPSEADRRKNELCAAIASQGNIWQTILELPRTTDRRSKIELALYSELVPDLYLAGRVSQLYLTAAQSTEHCLSGGMDDSVIYAFCAMGLMHAEREEFELSFSYEDLVEDLAARFPNTFGATRGLNGNAWVLTHTRRRPDEVVDLCLKAIESGKSCGDLYTAGISYGPLMWALQVQGADLGVIEEYARECQHFSERYNLAFSAGLAEAVQIGWLAAMKKGCEPVPMEERLARWTNDNHVAVLGSYYLHLALSRYYVGEHEQAAEALAETKRYHAGLSESIIKREWHVFQALNLLKLYERPGQGDRQVVLAEIAPLVDKVETWARLGPLWRPYLAFLHAERERVTGKIERARGLFLDAIESAHEAGYTLLEGHLNECLGELQITRGHGPARPYLMEASRLYRSCRAECKEALLRDRHPAIFEAEPAPAIAVEMPQAGPYALPQLDIGYIMRSALAISSEIEQEAVLRRIMETVIESSGAQHGYLLRTEGANLWVSAESHAGRGAVVTTVSRRLEETADICTAMLRYVFRTSQRIVLNDASQEGDFKDHPKVRELGLRSVLCLPVIKQGRLVGALYLENRLAPGMFTPAGIQTTELLAAQAAISLENARLVEEMRRAEEALAREREKLAVTLHSIGDAVIATDTTSHVTMINQVAEELTGWSQAEAQGKSLGEVFQIVNEETGAPAEDPVRRVLESGGVVGLANHTALISRDGRRLAIADSAAPIGGPAGEVLGVVLVFRDVTEARKTEQALQQSEHLLQLIIDSTPACIAYLDTSYRYRLANHTYKRWFGLEPESLRGRHVYDVVGKEAWEAVRPRLERATAGETISFEQQLAYSGGLRWVYSTYTPDRTGSGEVAGLVVHVMDIEKLVEAEASLREADRRKNEFLAVLSHELRNPLAPIRNSLYILGRAAPGSTQARRAHEVIDRQVEHMTRLIEDLLDITRITRGKIQLARERLDLNELALRTIEDHRSLFVKKEIEVAVDPAPAEVWVRGDKTRLAQAIGNLLQNAAKFTPRSGKATVSVLADPARGHAALTVKDTGRGIAPDIMPRLFEPFTQADATLDRSMGGLGLGLALVKGLVELHGGSVSVQSDGSGKGAGFTIRLALDEPAFAVSSARSPSQGRGTHRRILIIEDNVDAADSLCAALRLNGHIVEVAYSGPEGLEKARAFNPGVVLCDIGLPGMDGFDVARTIRSDRSFGRTFLVALSGYAQPEDVAKAKAAGFDSHLQKPADIETLERTLGMFGAPGKEMKAT